MQKSEAYITDKILWKAGQHGLPTKHALFFNDLSPDLQNSLSKQLETTISGAPILYFTKPTGEWTMICSKQIVFSHNEQINRIGLEDILELKPTAFPEISNGKMINIKSAQQKSEWHELSLLNKTQQWHILHAYTGTDFFSLWNILLMIKRFFE